MEPGRSDVTGLLAALSRGDEAAKVRLIEAVYSELRRLARAFLQRERRNHSLPPTALVHQAYLKLVDQGGVQWQNRLHFFAIAAHQMRRILVDHARSRRALKRAGGAMLPLDGIDRGTDPHGVDVLALDAALERLTAAHPRQGQLVELRFFAGLTVAETAGVLGVAPITVKRDWALAKAWLYREMQREV